MAESCKHGYGNTQICPKCYEATIAKPLSDEEIKAYPPIAELMKGNSYLQEKGRFLATVAADRKRIEELEGERDRTEGLIHIQKTIEDFYERQRQILEEDQYQGSKHERVIPIIIKCFKCGFQFTPGADEHCPQCQALEKEE